MDTSYLSTFIVLFQMMAVVIVLAYLITRTRSFSEVLSGIFTWKNQVFLILFFGALSIYGTVSGVSVLGAPVNIRDLGPMVGGLACGPIVGIGAGLIGAAYRFSLGGFTAGACSLATTLAGFLAGMVWLLNKRQMVRWELAVAFAVLIEGLHMGFVLLLARPYPDAVELVSAVAAPMILANATGMFIFAVIIGNLIAERKTRGERDRYQAELERKKAELEIARNIQQSLLPASLPAVKGMDIAAKGIPATEVGGDFYDVIPLQRGCTAILIADVSGKGVSAALFMALSRTVVRANALWHVRPKEVITDANRMIAKDASSGMFVTLFYAALDPEKHELAFVNAGHNPPILARKGESIRELGITGIALGALEDTSYEEHVVELEAGDVLVLYTDGVTEAVNNRDEQFGVDRLKDTIKSSGDSDARSTLERIVREVTTFAGDTPQHDDITLMVLRVLP
jgi:sigma-B regulation protein RsbU (phosphoserine phosphatase)